MCEFSVFLLYRKVRPIHKFIVDDCGMENMPLIIILSAMWLKGENR